MLTSSADRTLRLWNADTGKELLVFKGHTERIVGAALSSDGKRILSGSYDKTVRLWDVESGKEVCRFFGHTNWVWGVAVSPDGKFGLSGSLDKTVKIWDTETGQEVLTLRGHSNLVGHVLFDPSGRRLASGGEDRTVRVWQMDTCQLLHTLKGHDYPVTDVAISADGKVIVYEENFGLWKLDVASGQSTEIKIDITTDDQENNHETLTVNGEADSFHVSPSGKRAVIAVKGELFTIATEKGDVRRLRREVATLAAAAVGRRPPP